MAALLSGEVSEILRPEKNQLNVRPPRLFSLQVLVCRQSQGENGTLLSCPAPRLLFTVKTQKRDFCLAILD